MSNFGEMGLLLMEMFSRILERTDRLEMRRNYSNQWDLNQVRDKILNW